MKAFNVNDRKAGDFRGDGRAPFDGKPCYTVEEN